MNEKRIKVLTPGPINVPGFFNGPILTPYMEQVSIIYRLIISGNKVIEVCDNGKEIELNRDNYADNHNPVAKTVIEPEKKVEEPAEEEKVEEEQVEEPVETEVESAEAEENQVEPPMESETESTDIVVEEPAEEEKVEVKPQPKQFNNYKNNKKRN